MTGIDYGAVLIGVLMVCGLCFVAMCVIVGVGHRAAVRAELAVLEADPADLMSPAMATRFADWQAKLLDAVRSIDDLEIAVNEALAVANAQPVDPYELRWQQMCDPDHPMYDARVELENNLHPSLRKDAS